MNVTNVSSILICFKTVFLCSYLQLQEEKEILYSENKYVAVVSCHCMISKSSNPSGDFPFGFSVFNPFTAKGGID